MVITFLLFLKKEGGIMGFFQRLFGKSQDKETVSRVSGVKKDLDDWKPVPAYIPANQEDYSLVSLIATAIAAGDKPESQFVVKRVLQRNPEALKVSIIASSIAAGDYPDSQFAVKSIHTKK